MSLAAKILLGVMIVAIAGMWALFLNALCEGGADVPDEGVQDGRNDPL